MEKIVLVKSGYNLKAIHPNDNDFIRGHPDGTAFNAMLTKKSPRSLQHLRLFYALVDKTMDYWIPPNHVFNQQELDLVRALCDDLKDNHNIDIHQKAKQFLRRLAKQRAEQIRPREIDLDAFVAWLKEELGHYEWVKTPQGLKKVLKSISFAKMDQDEFNQFYRSAFNVCWDLVLQYEFDSYEQANEALNQLNLMS